MLACCQIPRKVKNLRRPFGPRNLEDRNQNDGAKSADRGEHERLPKQALASLAGIWQLSFVETAERVWTRNHVRSGYAACR
jgi:hypothetical protein